jgi:hypothetical protein
VATLKAENVSLKQRARARRTSVPSVVVADPAQVTAAQEEADAQRAKADALSKEVARLARFESEAAAATQRAQQKEAALAAVQGQLEGESRKTVGLCMVGLRNMIVRFEQHEELEQMRRERNNFM